jgi:hypothetical protein
MSSLVSALKPVLRFPFQGPDWQSRFLIGSALLLAGWFIPIVPAIFVFGYALEVLRRTLMGEEPSLLPWQDWGRLFVDGLRAFVVNLVYLLPGSLIYFGGLGLYLVGSLVLILAMEREAWGLGLFFALFIVFMIALFLGSLLIFLGVIPLPAATAHFVAEDRLASAFHIRRWWSILKDRRWEYLIAWIVVGGLALAFYFVMYLLYYTVCLCWLAPIATAPAAFYLMLVSAVLFGQAYRGSGE